MYKMRSLSLLLGIATPLIAAAGLSDSSLITHVNSLDLSFSFSPVIESYWTGFPHHRRTPFAVSPDGKSAYLAYLDDSKTDVHIQQVNPDDFSAVGTAVTVTGAKEAGGLVAHNDGFALLTNEALPSGTANAPSGETPVPVLYKYTNGKQAFKTFLGGPGVHAADGLSASPDLNGDLVYSETAKLYGAYFVVTDYSGDASGHFGDSVQYVSDSGTLETLAASSSWGCSHNTGIAFEAADAPPFAGVCAEDQGAIWLNTNTRGMGNDGVKVSNENTTNGGGGESLGGMGGSYSGLARFQDAGSYILAWVSRGASNLVANTWMGDGYTAAVNRTNGRNVAISLFSDKSTKVGAQASSTVGSEGDSQVNWITTSTTADYSNAHVATFDGSSALVTYEEIANPTCDFIAMGCQGEFTGAYYQLVTDGKKVGEPIKSLDTYVAGDLVTFPDGKICWPYVSMTWSLKLEAAAAATSTKKISFACISNGSNGTTASASSASSAAAASSTVATTSSVATQGATIETTSAVSAASSVAESYVPATSAVPTSAASAEYTTVESSATSSSAAESSVVATSAAPEQYTSIQFSAASSTAASSTVAPVQYTSVESGAVASSSFTSGVGPAPSSQAAPTTFSTVVSPASGSGSASTGAPIIYRPSGTAGPSVGGWYGWTGCESSGAPRPTGWWGYGGARASGYPRPTAWSGSRRGYSPWTEESS